jgi:hypothetical protein
MCYELPTLLPDFVDPSHFFCKVVKVSVFIVLLEQNLNFVTISAEVLLLFDFLCNIYDGSLFGLWHLFCEISVLSKRRYRTVS